GISAPFHIHHRDTRKGNKTGRADQWIKFGKPLNLFPPPRAKRDKFLYGFFVVLFQDSKGLWQECSSHPVRIEPAVADDTEVFIRDMPDQLPDKLLRGQGMVGEFVCFMVNKVEGHRFSVIADNA